MIELKNVIDTAQIAMSMPTGMSRPELAGNPEASWCPYYRFLYMWVNTYKPAAVLECGVYNGTASEHMAVANPGTVVIGVDLVQSPRMWDVRQVHFNVHYIIGDTLLVHRQVEQLLNHRKLGLLFLDSKHDGITPKAEFELYRAYLDTQALVVCDDVDCNDEMRDFWNWMPGEKLRLDYLHPKLHDWYPETGFGVSILRTEL